MDGSNQDYERATSALESKIGVENVSKINQSQIVIKLPDGKWSKPITWHHHENGKSMVPIISEVHNDNINFRHTGGRAILNPNRGLMNIFDLIF